MTKQLILTKKIDDYILTLKEDINCAIIIENKTIKGEDLYTLFYKDSDGPSEYKVITDLKEQNDKIVFNQLVTLFKKIDEQVNGVYKKD